MKLLFDENTAPSLVKILGDIYPESAHVRDIGLKASTDPVAWDHARRIGYTIVTKDSDFRQRSFLYGQPPKVIWIRLGNWSTKQIAELPRQRRDHVEEFYVDDEQAFLSLG